MINMNTNLANDLLGAVATTFDSGQITCRAGARPSNAEATKTGTVLATIALPADSLGTAASRQITANGLPWEDISADASGTIGWACLENSAATRRVDLAVTAAGGGGDMEVENTVVVASQDIKVTSFSFAIPLTYP